jgi:hypothetical protein
MLLVPAVLKVPESSTISGERVPVGDPAQASLPVKVHSSPYVKVYRNVPQVPVITTPIHPEALVGYVPAVPVLVGPQHAPQIPYVSPVVTSAHSNAPQVPSLFEHPNVSAPKVPVVGQNVPKVAVIPENIDTIFSPVGNIPQTAPQDSFIPEITYSNAPQVPVISHNAEVPLIAENVRESVPQISIISQNVPLIPIVSKFHVEKYPKVPVVAQNSQGTVEPLNFHPSVPQEKFISHSAPSVPVVSPVSSPQVPFASTNGLRVPHVPVKLHNPVDYNLQTDSTVHSVPTNPQNEVADVDAVSHNVPKKPFIVATNINSHSHHSTKFSQDSSESSEKAFIPSQCQTIIHEKSGATYPTLKFKHVLNPPENIQEYYKTASDEVTQAKFFRCHQENEIGYVSSSERLAYHCHSDDIPVKLLVEVPKAVQGGQIIDVELDTPYTAMALHAANGDYEGVQKAAFLQDLLKPCSYGVAVLRPEGFATRVIYLPVAVPDGKFVMHRIDKM